MGRRKRAPKAGPGRAPPAGERARQDAVAGVAEVVCLYCGCAFRAITTLHLRRLHDYEGDHPILDYRQRFGLEVAHTHSHANRRQARRVRAAYWEARGRRWTRARMLDAIRERHRRGLSLAHQDVPNRLRQAVRRRLGPWRKALRMARVPCPPRRSRWNAIRVIAEVRALAARGRPLYGGYISEHHPELHNAAHNHLGGGWGRALTAAGLDPSAHRAPTSPWTRQLAEAWVRRRAARAGSVRRKDAPADLVTWVVNHVNHSWVAFVQALHIPCAGGKRRDWSAAAVVQAIRARKRTGHPLYSKAVARAGGGLIAQARKHFGGWPAALAAAGFDPAKHQGQLRWTRDAVVAAIRRRWRAGQSVDRRTVLASSRSGLVNAAVRHCGGWRAAVHAAQRRPR